jgi:LuxR family maltose regulon positive regulatory protein
VKSTCISEWVESLETPLTWLSLDPADDDLGRFFAYLIAVFHMVNGGLDRAVKNLIKSETNPSAETIRVALINEILDAGIPFILVLDDLHVIQDHIILQRLEDIVSNPPPGSCFT